MITPQQSVEELASIVGLESENAVITGTDPVYPIVPRAVTAGAAALAAVGLAAADLWALKTGSPAGGADIDAWGRTCTAISSTSERGTCGHSAETDRRRTRGHQMGWARSGRGDLCGRWRVWLRSQRSRMAGHQTGESCLSPASAGIIKIGDSAPGPLPEGGMPLSGLRALDLTRVLAGPTCAKMLAEFGADVMKISCPGLAHGGLPDFDAELGKLSAYIDMRNPGEMETLKHLVAQSDLFVQAYRPGTLDARGFSPGRLSPRTIAVRRSCPWPR
ncbi:MAG: CoA transferase [Alphaproteobacteria bacterium]